MDKISIVISIIALTISALAFWLTRMKKGTIKMTRPTMIFFGPDGGKNPDKVFIRTLLYSTSDRGQYIQNMFINLRRGESSQNFNVWVYGDKQFSRGSGLYVDKSGVTVNHHFLLPKDANYSFLAGDYLLQVYVEMVDKMPMKIFEQQLQLTTEQANAMVDNRAGIYFDWAPNSQSYSSHVELRQLTGKEASELLM
ncbi:MAG: hypothetical protein JWO32_736 [Bacteroidetes bacterium]|nr:hypothetical protein [Bacteroidota bacterium]